MAVILGRYVEEYLEHNDLGIVTGADGPLYVDPDQMRYPDLAFFVWDKFPNRLLPRNPLPSQRKSKYRVLKDFTGSDGSEHKRGDIVEMTFDEARAFVNSDKVTADLSELPNVEAKEQEKS